MPAPRRTQNNTMLYTVIAFVGISIIATVVAIVFYIKYEDRQAKLQQRETDFKQLIREQDWRQITSIVGEKKSPTYLGQMNDYLNQMVTMVVGGPLEETSAQVKVESANATLMETIGKLAAEPIELQAFDPNTTGLIRVIEKLAAKLTNAIQAGLDLSEKLKQLHAEFEKVEKANREKEQHLLAELGQYKQQVDDVIQKYSQLEQLLKQTTDERVQALVEQRDQAESQRKTTYDDLLKTRAQLDMTAERLEALQKQIWTIKGPPDKDVAAYKPDGSVMLVDNGVVHINIGSDDKVYQGLTFAIYDKSLPIPKNGRGKAEIEVFDVRKNVSIARIVRSETRRPIVKEDIVTNLIWDSEEANIFVVAGEFDIDADGSIDYDAIQKISELIERWGGQVAQTVTIDTDFVVLGRPPRIPPQPSAEDLEIDPAAEQKYEAAFQKRQQYDKMEEYARGLWIPVLNIDRFLYFVGYKELSKRPDAF